MRSAVVRSTVGKIDPPSPRLRRASYGEAKRTWTIGQSQSAGRAWPEIKSQTETATDSAWWRNQTEQTSGATRHRRLMDAADQLRAMQTKIARVLVMKLECFITHPAELSVLKQLNADELQQFARDNGWQIVRRLGGRQIEFYNDVTVRDEEETART